jgi:hypothetical protein
VFGPGSRRQSDSSPCSISRYPVGYTLRVPLDNYRAAFTWQIIATVHRVPRRLPWQFIACCPVLLTNRVPRRLHWLLIAFRPIRSRVVFTDKSSRRHRLLQQFSAPSRIWSTCLLIRIVCTCLHVHFNSVSRCPYYWQIIALPSTSSLFSRLIAFHLCTVQYNSVMKLIHQFPWYIMLDCCQHYRHVALSSLTIPRAIQN